MKKNIGWFKSEGQHVGYQQPAKGGCGGGGDDGGRGFKSPDWLCTRTADVVTMSQLPEF